jgi:hypothetical protein
MLNARAVFDVDSRSHLALSTKCAPAQTVKKKKGAFPGNCAHFLVLIRK